MDVTGLLSSVRQDAVSLLRGNTYTVDTSVPRGMSHWEAWVPASHSLGLSGCAKHASVSVLTSMVAMFQGSRSDRHGALAFLLRFPLTCPSGATGSWPWAGAVFSLSLKRLYMC